MTPSATVRTVEEATLRSVRGTAFPMVAAAARSSAGEGPWLAILGMCSPEARAVLENPPSPATWLDPGIVAECFAIFKRTGNLGRVPGALGAETFRARSPQAFQDPVELLGALPGFWRASTEGGVMETEVTGPGTGVVRLWALWKVPYFFEEHAPAWFTHGLKLAGAQAPVVRYVPPPEPGGYLHEYHLQWS